MQRLHNYLLTNHPLIWNLRLHLVWPAIVLLHLAFFLAGYFSVSFPQSVGWYALRAGSATVSMAFLMPMLLGVLWLVFYLRNNAFKSFYPLKRGRLAAEAGLIFLTCFGFTTFIPSFEEGSYSHMRSLTKDIDLVRETNVTNLAHHFIPFLRSSFASSNDCNYRRPDIEDAELRSQVEDSLRASLPEVDTFSYLHYCDSDVPLYNMPGARTVSENDTIAKRWLLAGRQDSVRMILQEYLALCRKYRADYNFNVDRHVRNMFAEPGFPLRYEVGRYNYSTDVNYAEDVETVPVQPQEGPAANFDPKPTSYIIEQRVSEALEVIHEARDGWFSLSTALFIFYWTLALALLIFTFRITAVKTWFIALIGTGIWCAIFGVIGSAFSVLRSEDGLMGIFMLLSVGFQATAFYLIYQKQSKLKAGVLYLWGLWSLPFLVPLLFNVLQHITRPVDVYDPVRKLSVTPPAPFHDWIQDNWPLIGGGNIVFFLLMLALLYIPLARKWQAMPEE